MNTVKEALGLVFAMGAVILFCRAFPFLFFSNTRAKKDNAPPNTPPEEAVPAKRQAFLDFVEKTVPPAAMAVLAFNALGTSFRDNPRDGLFALAASVFTALLHLWKRNFLLSIIGGTALYMVLGRVVY